MTMKRFKGPPPVVSEFQAQYLRRVERLENLVERATAKLEEAREICAHVVGPYMVTDELRAHLRKQNGMGCGDGASCAVCGVDLGWLCPESPDGVCHYFTDNGKVVMSDGVIVDSPPHDTLYETEDSCLFCGAPEERK